MMRTNASLHADQARWHVGKSRVHLATRPLLPQHDRPALIKANNVERVLTNIDAHYDDHGVQYLRHGVLLVFGAYCQLRSLAGQEHGRTIPLAEVALPYLNRVFAFRTGVTRSGVSNFAQCPDGYCHRLLKRYANANRAQIEWRRTLHRTGRAIGCWSLCPSAISSGLCQSLNKLTATARRC